jgi:hypothetical protein
MPMALAGVALTLALPLTVSVVIKFSFCDGILRDCWLIMLDEHVCSNETSPGWALWANADAVERF